MSKLNEEVKKELASFINSLDVVLTPSDLRAPKDLFFDSGLVVFEDSLVGVDEVADCLAEEKRKVFLLDNEYDDYGFLKALIEANEKGQWLIVDCKIDPSPQMISILKQVSDRNSFTVPNFNNQELFSLKINSNTRIIFCIESKLLEKITYPSFVNLFGPVIRI